jgi:hypothetical protein
VQKLLLLSIYIVHFFLLIRTLYLFILSNFKDSLEASLMDFLAILHSLSYQGLVVLFFFLHNTSIENLLMEVERVVVKL